MSKTIQVCSRKERYTNGLTCTFGNGEQLTSEDGDDVAAEYREEALARAEADPRLADCDFGLDELKPTQWLGGTVTYGIFYSSADLSAEEKAALMEADQAGIDAANTMAKSIEAAMQDFDCTTCDDTGKVWDEAIDDWREDSACPDCSSDKEAELAQWVEDQKAAYKAGTLTPQQIQRLESLPGWNW